MGTRVRLVRAGSVCAVVFLITGTVFLQGLGHASAFSRPERDTDYCPSRGSLSAARLPSTVSPRVCDLEGRTIRSGSVVLEVPDPGHGVGAAAVGLAGETQLTVATATDGTVFVFEDSEEAAATLGSGGPYPPCDGVFLSGCLDPCTDDNYNVYDVNGGAAGGIPRVKVSQPWKFKPTTTPSSLTTTQALGQIKRGTKNIVDSFNDCGQPDVVTQTAPYKGTTTAQSGIVHREPSGGTPYDACKSRADDTNMVDFGKLVSTGLACSWFTSTNGTTWFIARADIRLNKDSPWTINPADPACSNLVDVQSVMTHERGHTFGLAHTDQASPTDNSHAPQTMFWATYVCGLYGRTLGLGDWSGLEFLYD